MELPPGFVTGTAQISYEIPGSVQRAIAQAIIAFSYLETTAEIMIWDTLKVPIDDGRIFTRTMPANRKFVILNDLLKPRLTPRSGRPHSRPLLARYARSR